MAYMSQDKKRELAPAIKKVLSKYGMKGTLAVNNHSTLVLNIRSGAIDFGDKLRNGHVHVNHYHIERNWEGQAQQFLLEVRDAMMKGNWDKSDIMTDYFNVGWYIDINIGRWNKPYICTETQSVDVAH